MSLQLDESEKEKLADYIIKNNQDIDCLLRDVKKFCKKIIPT
jgi:dephospho-CoA kinase